MMKVTTYIINKGQPTQYYGLKNATDNQVLYDAPNNWKTEKEWDEDCVVLHAESPWNL